MSVITRLQLVRGTRAELNATNLSDGEPGLVHDELKFAIGYGGVNYLMAEAGFRWTLFIDHGGAVLPVGKQVWARVPFDMQLLTWELTSMVNGNVTVDVWVTDYAGWPPTDAPDSIAAGVEPAFVGAVKATGNYAGWVQDTLAAGDYMLLNVDACVNVTGLAFTFIGTRN